MHNVRSKEVWLAKDAVVTIVICQQSGHFVFCEET